LQYIDLDQQPFQQRQLNALIGGQKGVFGCHPCFFRNPAQPDDDLKAQQKLALDRYRIASEIDQRMRQAGISCELYDHQKRH
jgi:hypothetical protein